jgi:hypothetical protein
VCTYDCLVKSFGDRRFLCFHNHHESNNNSYKGKLYKNMLADHCWNLIRESSLSENNDQRHFFVKFP